MYDIKRWTCGALLALVVAAPVAAQAKGPHPVATEVLRLESFQPGNPGFAGPVVTKGYLPAGKLYVAQVRGTVSYYSKDIWLHPSHSHRWTMVCGVPERQPQYRSPHRPRGPVGVDAEFLFARPWTLTNCLKHPLPHHWTNFQIKDDVMSYHHIAALGPLLTAPAANHTYRYPLVGANARARFRLKDIPGTWDNYGILKITVRRATAADCANGQYAAFGEATQAACEAATH